MRVKTPPVLVLGIVGALVFSVSPQWSSGEAASAAVFSQPANSLGAPLSVPTTAVLPEAETPEGSETSEVSDGVGEPGEAPSKPEPSEDPAEPSLPSTEQPADIGGSSIPEDDQPAGDPEEGMTPAEEEDPGDEVPEVIEISSATPSIRGVAQAGKVLQASPGAWMPATVSFTYQWTVNGKNISGATTANYRVKASDRGKKIAVQVTGALEGSESRSQTSKASSVLKLLKTKQPTIGGTSKWHRYLSVKPTGWTSGTAFTYQWYRNGKAVGEKRAKKSKYRIHAKDWCQTVTVKVTGKKAGYETASKVSKVHQYAGCPKANNHRLYVGQRVDAGKQIASKNWKHAATITKSGTMYLYNHGRARWGAVGGAGGSKLLLTPNGNLVVKKGNTVAWQSRTAGKGVKYAAVNAAGELGLYKANGKRVWTASKNNGYRWNNWGTPSLSQNDPRWAGATIGYYRFGPVGCVPTAFAMAAQGYGLNVNPYSVGVQMHNGGDFNHGVAGAGGQSIVAAAKANGLAATPLSTKGQVSKALKNNQPVIALVSGPYSITSPGSTHAVVLTGLYNGEYTTVKNPWGNISDTAYTLSMLWAYQSWDSLDRNAGAVFWAIG